MRALAARSLLALAPALLLAPAPAPAAPAYPAPPPPSPHSLLLLRAACPTQDTALFTTQRLLAHAATDAEFHRLASYRILGFNETCGASWRQTTWRAVLSTLSGGGAASGAGWPGARLCALLGAAAGRSAPPAACAAPHARAAVLSTLARRLRWQRALLLPPAEPDSECGASLRASAAVLRALPVAVVYGRLTNEKLDPHVVVACYSGVDGAQLVEWPDHVAVLLLHFTSIEDATFASNITLDVGDSPYIQKVAFKDLKSTDSQINIGSFMQQEWIFTNKSNDVGRKEAFAPRLMLSDMRLELRESRPTAAALYRELAEAARASPAAPRTARLLYHLYEIRSSRSPASPAAPLVWRHALTFAATATRSTAADDEWTARLEPVNDTDEWERWQIHEEPGGATVGAIGWGVASFISAVSVVIASAVLIHVIARRRRGRRRRGDVVLSAAEFAFPADEPRRLPDGMETMLSCWLQQLHEFGGPELERPDLLKQPAPPSAPSSTASGSRLALDRRTRYKGDAVHLKPLPLGFGVPTLELRRKATDVLLTLHSLRHENLNPFIGCLCETRVSLVWDYCGRGSLEDVLMADDIKLDWTFRLSLLTDLVKGLRYLHASPLRVHGRLSSRNCVVDSRWVLRLTDYGLPEFYRAQGLCPPPRTARDLLWTAPELLRAGEEARGTQPGDVFSFAIIMQEVIVRGEPYCMLSLTPNEIVEKLCRPPPLIRPSVSMGAAPPEAVSVMRQCWAEAADLRPSTDSLHDIFRLLHRGRKINIVDSMFEMLEKYSNNLEELIKERTDQLDMEKKKTEQLLNRMLPKSVAERLVLGLRVEPEEFEEVSIYFSDIVGFTALAARSTPVQVVAVLNDLYTTFDAAIQQYRVYKVETIGDAYMVVGGLPVRARDHAESVATMALHLLHLAGRFRVRHLPHTPLHLRIGLHSGPCCAGVVGLTMPRYCLFGDTVNTASRMESTGAAWRIHLSAATAARLEAAGGYRLRSRGLTLVKGKGSMHTYWLLGKDGFDKPLPSPPPLPAEETLVEQEQESESAEGEPPAVDAALAGDAVDPEPVPTAHHHTDKLAWQRSGAVSADSSPPATPYDRYRCRGGGSARALRRQWSLERGEALAVARATPASPPEARPEAPPLALAAGPARASRYRTRPDPDFPAPPSASFD